VGKFVMGGCDCITVTLPPILGSCTTNCSLHFLEVSVEVVGVVGVLPIISVSVTPIHCKLLLLLSLGVPHGWALTVLIVLVDPPNKAGPLMWAVDMRGVAMFADMSGEVIIDAFLG
jgi:hypothetical protein